MTGRFAFFSRDHFACGHHQGKKVLPLVEELAGYRGNCLICVSPKKVIARKYGKYLEAVVGS